MVKYVLFYYVDNKLVFIYLFVFLVCKMVCYWYNGMNMFSYFVIKLKVIV